MTIAHDLVIHALMGIFSREVSFACEDLAFPRIYTDKGANTAAMIAPATNKRGSKPGGRRVMKYAVSICGIRVLTP